MIIDNCIVLVKPLFENRGEPSNVRDLPFPEGGEVRI